MYHTGVEMRSSLQSAKTAKARDEYLTSGTRSFVPRLYAHRLTNKGNVPTCSTSFDLKNWGSSWPLFPLRNMWCHMLHFQTTARWWCGVEDRNPKTGTIPITNSSMSVSQIEIAGFGKVVEEHKTEPKFYVSRAASEGGGSTGVRTPLQIVVFWYFGSPQSSIRARHNTRHPETG